MQELLFELSENNSPLTDAGGNVVTCIGDVVDVVYAVSPAIADLVNLVLSNQRKQIENLRSELQALEEDSEKEKDSLQDELNLVLSNTTQLAEFDISDLQNEIEFQQEHEGTIQRETATMLIDKLEDIASSLRNIQGY